MAGTIESTTGGVKFPDGTQQTTSAAAWKTPVAKTFGTNYQSAVDGFVVAGGYGSAASCYILGYSDATSTPSTMVSQAGNGGQVRMNISFPVVAGQYYRVDKLANCDAGLTYYFWGLH